MNNGAKISIVIPVYNGEKTIERCINSVLNQNYSNYELIIVDDGSNDKTPIILSRYKQLKNIKIFHKTNGGVSSARNLGLRYVSGDYLMFLDSDDCILEQGLSDLAQMIYDHSEADVIIYGWKEDSFDKSKTIRHTNLPNYIEIDECINSILTTEQKYGGGYPWNKIWKVNNLKADNLIIGFNEKLILCEDKEWTIRALLKQKKVLLSDIVVYNYINVGAEHLSIIDFDLVDDKNNRKIISFLNASVIICDLLSISKNSTTYQVAELVRNRDIIMIVFKSIKNKNRDLYSYAYKYYLKFINGKVKRYNIKTFLMFIYIRLYEIKNRY